jgi:hypothetical protein
MNNKIDKIFCCLRPNTRIIILTGMFLYTLTACAQFYRVSDHEEIAFLLGYSSQRHIVKQGYSVVPTPKGNVPAVYFGYDRNRDYGPTYPEGTRRGIDVVEFKLLSADGGWIWTPLLIIVDDDFDGLADRLWADTDLDGKPERCYPLKDRDVKMDAIEFSPLNPWPVEPESKAPKTNPGI